MSHYLGSCLCGGVQIALSGTISSIIHCHCSRCRKASGSAYATNGFVERSALQLRAGEELMRSFESAPGKQRFFCGRCGSPLYSANAADPSRLRIRLGLLDSDINERPMSHNFVSSRANWEDMDAELPHYDGREPGRT